MEVRMIGSGQYAAATPAQPQALAAHDEASYDRLWTSAVGRGEAPPVDFENDSVVILLAGSRPTGGFTIEVRGAAMEGETLVIDASVKPPPAGAIVTQAFTSPYAVIAVNAKFKDVRWPR